MFHIMKLHHKNKPLGMQTFLGQVTVLYINIFKAFGIIGTIMAIALEVSVTLSEQGAALYSIAGK